MPSDLLCLELGSSTDALRSVCCRDFDRICSNGFFKSLELVVIVCFVWPCVLVLDV